MEKLNGKIMENRREMIRILDDRFRRNKIQLNINSRGNRGADFNKEIVQNVGTHQVASTMTNKTKNKPQSHNQFIFMTF